MESSSLSFSQTQIWVTQKSTGDEAHNGLRPLVSLSLSESHSLSLSESHSLTLSLWKSFDLPVWEIANVWKLGCSECALFVSWLNIHYSGCKLCSLIQIKENQEWEKDSTRQWERERERERGRKRKRMGGRELKRAREIREQRMKERHFIIWGKDFSFLGRKLSQTYREEERRKREKVGRRLSDCQSEERGWRSFKRNSFILKREKREPKTEC